MAKDSIKYCFGHEQNSVYDVISISIIRDIWYITVSFNIISTEKIFIR